MYIKPLEFSAAGIEMLLKDLETTKSCGPDYLSASFLQCMSSELSPALELSFKYNPPARRAAKSLETHVSLIFTKGNKTNAEN